MSHVKLLQNSPTLRQIFFKPPPPHYYYDYLLMSHYAFARMVSPLGQQQTISFAL